MLALFFVVEALCGFISYNGTPTLREIVENTVFLSFIPLYSRLSVSSREGIRKALELAAIAGAFAALGLSLYQVAILHERAEGGAGNAVPFAVANLVGYAILWLGCMRASGRLRMGLGAAICAAAFSVILSGTRSLWPALFVVSIIAGLIYRRHFSFLRVGRMAAVLLLLVTCFGALNARFIENRVF